MKGRPGFLRHLQLCTTIAAEALDVIEVDGLNTGVDNIDLIERFGSACSSALEGVCGG